MRIRTQIHAGPTRPACDNCTAGKRIQGQPGQLFVFRG